MSAAFRKRSRARAESSPSARTSPSRTIDAASPFTTFSSRSSRARPLPVSERMSEEASSKRLAISGSLEDELEGKSNTRPASAQGRYIAIVHACLSISALSRASARGTNSSERRTLRKDAWGT